MKALWDHSPATVTDVVERIDGPTRPAYTSVLTILRILERKGYVQHEKQGRAFTYTPLVDRGQARRGALMQLLSRFFDGSREQLMVDLLAHEEVDARQLQQIRALLDDASVTAAKRPRRR